MLSQCLWREYKSENGRVYFHNIDTKESRWTKPKELEDIEKAVTQQQQQQQSINDSPNMSVVFTFFSHLSKVFCFVFQDAFSCHSCNT